MLLGPARIRQWATLMLASDVTDGSETDLREIVLFARLCQLLAHRRSAPAQTAFTVGLLAAMAELLGVSASELASHFPLSDQITDALVLGAGDLGRVLADVRAYHLGQIDASTTDVSDAILAALQWTTAALQTTTDTG
jgi:EAL and modified HD-GYP domain-containing signal transduction protein